MIELPPWAIPNGASPALLDFGGVLRPDLGGPLQRVDRQGSRYRVALTFPVFSDPGHARVVVSRLVRAKRMGLRCEFPLVERQPLVDGLVSGGGQSGTTLLVRGLTPGAVVREGFWMSIEAANGQHYLHNTAGEVIVDADGRAALPLSEMLRAPFVDGARVHLVRPMIEGLVDGSEQAWQVSVENYVSIEVTIEEAA